MDDFTTRVYLVVLALARRLFRGDDSRVQNAVGNAFYQYQQAPRRLEITATAFAWAGCRRELGGRGIPGTQARRTDALSQADTWTAGSMEGVLEHRPGPERIARARDLLDRLRRQMTPRERTIAQRLADGQEGRMVAFAVGVSPGRLSQIRREMKEKCEG